jgi:hypothetical protein
MPAPATGSDNVHANPSRAGRICAYIAEMFPPLVYIPAAVMNFAAVYFAVQAMEGLAPLRFTWRAAAGAMTTVLFYLLLRVYDELKDVETDLRLGRAGDPRYKDRAIVTGRIQVGDLQALRWLLTAALIALNVPLGFPVPALVFAAVFALTWLSFKWFFWPAMSRNLLLAFATHNPLAMALGAYAAAVAVRDFGAIERVGLLAVLLIGIWTSMAAWEISRKIRCEADETAYTTYSKVLGWRLAGVLPLLFGGISATCLIAVAGAIGLGWPYTALVLAGALILAAACLRFEFRPTAASANLRPYAELYSLAAVASLPVFLLIRFGLAY